MTKPRWVEPLGRRIEELMQERLWNQQDLAERAGINQKTISNLVRGANAPRTHTIRSVMAAFGQDGVEALRDLGHEGWADAVEIAVEERRQREAVEKLIREGALDHFLED